MRIGIDIDNTITNTSSYIKEMLEKNNLSELGTDLDNYTKEELFKYDKLIRNNIEDIMANAPLNKDSKEVIERLYKKHEIYIITARNNFFSDNLYKITLDYLNNRGILFHELLFGYEEKREICIEKKIDIMLDDNIIINESLTNTKVRNVLFSTEHNKSYKGEKVSNWLEFEKIVTDHKEV